MNAVHMYRYTEVWQLRWKLYYNTIQILVQCTWLVQPVLNCTDEAQIGRNSCLQFALQVLQSLLPHTPRNTSDREELGKEPPKTPPARTVPTRPDRGGQEGYFICQQLVASRACDCLDRPTPSRKLRAMTETDDKPLQKTTPLLQSATTCKPLEEYSGTFYCRQPLIRTLTSILATQR